MAANDVSLATAAAKRERLPSSVETKSTCRKPAAKHFRALVSFRCDRDFIGQQRNRAGIIRSSLRTRMARWQLWRVELQ